MSLSASTRLGPYEVLLWCRRFIWEHYENWRVPIVEDEQFSSVKGHLNILFYLVQRQVSR